MLINNLQERQRTIGMLRRKLFLKLLLLVITVVSVKAENNSTTIVVLVRHAEKEYDGTKDPDLSPAGYSRAQALAHVLDNVNLEHIIITQYQRTGLTAQIVARRKGLTPEIISVSRPLEDHFKLVAKAIFDKPGEATLVVGHSNTIVQIIHALGGPKLTELKELEYANFFVLILKDNEPARLIRSRYGVPDEVDRINYPDEKN